MRSANRLLTLVGAAFAAVVLAAAPCRAQVVIGTNQGYNGIPFGFGNQVTRYQQVYLGSAFTSPFSIESISFFSEAMQGGVIPPGSYTFAFSTTSASPTSLSSTLANNVGTPLVTFATTTGGSATVSGVPYVFDPALGNLLLDITVDVQSGSAAFQAGIDSRTARAWQAGGSGNLDGPGVTYGFLTQFDGVVATTTTPEPTGVVLLATGLLGVFGAARRKRSASRDS